MKLAAVKPHQLAMTLTATAALILVPAVAVAASGHHAAKAPESLAQCQAAGIKAWLGIPADGAAGTSYYQLELTNLSHRTCTLYGYPRISAYRGSQLGSPATRNHLWSPLLITLSPGMTAHAVLGIKNAGVLPRLACHPVTAAGLRVYLPGDRQSVTIPFSFRACAKVSPKYLTITTTRSRPGIPS
jgi:hypothetical protein